MSDEKLVQIAFIWESSNGKRQTRPINLNLNVDIEIDYDIMEDAGREKIVVTITQDSPIAKSLKVLKELLND